MILRKGEKINQQHQQNEKKIATIIIPAYNEESVIADCLNSIIQQNYDENLYEILIVNDGSTDRTCEIAESFVKRHPNAKLLSKENGGKASAQNFGLRHAEGKYILITDADAVVEPEWILKLIKHLEDVEMVIGSYYAKNPKTWLEKIQHAHYLIKFKFGGHRGVPCFGVNNAFRREVVNKIGFFDETKTSITEDYICRIQNAGLKINFDPNIVVYTQCTKNLRSFIKQKLRWRESGFLIFNLDFIYTYGLSFLLFGSLFLSLITLNISFGLIAFFLLYLLSFSIYFIPLIKMIVDKENRHYSPYFILYELIEMGIRFILVPYIIYRIISPRKSPTFSANRDL